MPVDLSKPHSDRRKINRDAAAGLRQDGMYSREIEMKRNRGEISCAECRRLKIKCDKQIPCQSCQRRGCASLCPNGSLATGQGTRFVIAATEHLHRRIARMGDRIRELEDALAVLQASHSSEPHPLLCEGSILVDTDKPEEPQESEDEGAEEVTKSLGTLTVSENGLSRFFGFTGGSDLLLLENDDSVASPSQTTESDSSRASLPLHLQRFSYSFPFTPMGTVKQNIEVIRDYLPPWERALVMADNYLTNGTWIFRNITRQQLMNEMLPAIYGKRSVYAPDDHIGPHDLALLFSVFALGCIMDTSVPVATSESEGEHYNQLALAALCQQAVLEKPSLVTIQTMHVLSYYNAMLGGDVNGGESTMESTWSLIAVACHLAQTIGLHRDPARWETDPKIVQRRRLIFWDLFIADAYHALSTGRPPVFNRTFIDCKFPQDVEVPTNLEPGDVSSMSVWMYRFSFEAMAEIVARTHTATPPRYSAIKELDRKVHEFRVAPEIIQGIRGGPGVDPKSIPTPASMMAFMLSNVQDVVLLFLHRNFFVQALIEDPENPIRSQYAPSFLATVRASKNILRTVEEQLPIQPIIVSRFWTIWTFTFSAAVVFAFIATQSPRSPLANDAIIELDRAYTLIDMASKTNRRALRALAILSRMREKAHQALATVHNTPSTQPPDVKQEEMEDDFVVFAGRRRVFRPGGTGPATSQTLPTPQDPTLQHDEHNGAGDSMLGEWLTRQEQYVGYDPHYVAAIEPPPSAPHDQHPHQHPHQQQHQQHQHREYGYAPAQPQYTLEAAPPPPHYMTAPYAAYAPPPHPPPPQLLHPHAPHHHPHDLHHPSSSSHAPLGMGHSHPSHVLHGDEMADMRRDYAVTARAPPSELAQLGFAAHGSRVNDTWLSFIE